MADRKISDLTALLTPATGDLLPIVDISEAAAADKNKSITVGELLRGAPDGTAAAPGFAFESDGGNGMFLGGTDILAFSTGGTQAVTIDASQRLGVGTSSPSSTALLDVNGKIAAVEGSAAEPAIHCRNDTNTGINFVGADRLSLVTAGGNRLFIDSAGSVGINTASPNRLLEVSAATVDNFIRVNTTGATKSGIEFASGGVVYSQLYFDNVSPYDLSLLQQYSTGSVILGTNNTERARIDSDGRLLVGTSSDFTGGTGGPGTGQFVAVDSAGQLNLGRNGATFSAGTSIGLLRFWSNTGDTGEVARIACEGDNPGGSGDKPGRLVFSTTADGASSPTERMRIDSNGWLYSLPTYNKTAGAAANVGVNAGDGVFFRSTSSIKYKRDVVDYDKGLQEVLQLRPVYYKGKSEFDGDTQFAGLIAEEIDELGLKEFVQYAEDGSPDALAYGHMVSLLTKAIQQQQTMIAELQAEVAALKGA